MTKIFTISALLFFSNAVFSQKDSVIIGGYRNIVEFNKQEPSYKANFIFTKKEFSKIPKLYSAKSTNRKLRGSITNKSIFIIYNGSSYYINSDRIGMASGYIKIDTLWSYSHFQGTPIKSVFQQEQIRNSFYYFGAAGYAISSINVYEQNKGNIHYVFNRKTGIINLLNRQYLTLILKPHSNLSFKYQLEQDKDSLDVILKYLRLLNKEIEDK